MKNPGGLGCSSALEERDDGRLELLVEEGGRAHVAEAVFADVVDAAGAVGAGDLGAVDRALGALDVEAPAPVVEAVALAGGALELEDVGEVAVLGDAEAVAHQRARGPQAELGRADRQHRAVVAAAVEGHEAREAVAGAGDELPEAGEELFLAAAKDLRGGNVLPGSLLVGRALEEDHAAVEVGAFLVL